MAVIDFSEAVGDAPPFVRVGCTGTGLWVRLVCYSVHHNTDGLIPGAVLAAYDTSPSSVRQLLEAGLLRWDTTNAENFRVVNIQLGGRPSFRVKVPRTRAPIPPEVRLAVYARDGHRCVECDAAEDLTLDHIIPWSKGGPDTEDNLRVLCRSCNSRKGARIS